MKINILDVLKRDDVQQQEQHKIDGEDKKGQLRAGNSGILLDDGNVAGSCHRAALLRLQGIDLDAEDNRLIMFEYGRSNEAVIIEKLKRQLGTTFDILGDDVNLIEWDLPTGRKVSGRPDIVLYSKKDKQPLLVIEMKLVSSLWTAVSVMFGDEPKLAHIIQAAHYGIKLGVPTKLVYISAVDWQVPWKIKELPEEGSILSEYLEYTDKKNTKTNKMERSPKKILPFRVAYDLEIDGDGFVRYRKEDSKNKWTITPVTMKYIEEFYYLVDKMNIDGLGLGPRPITLKACGDFASYNLCDYCQIKPFCDRLENQPAKWLEEVRKANDAGQLKK